MFVKGIEFSNNHPPTSKPYLISFKESREQKQKKEVSILERFETCTRKSLRNCHDLELTLIPLETKMDNFVKITILPSHPP